MEIVPLDIVTARQGGPCDAQHLVATTDCQTQTLASFSFCFARIFFGFPAKLAGGLKSEGVPVNYELTCKRAARKGQYEALEYLKSEAFAV